MKKPYHHGNLKEELIAAGISVLKKEGTGGLRLREVAGLVGVSHASLYRHFTNKEELLAAIAEQGFRGLIENVELYRKRAGSNFKSQFIEAGRAYVDFAASHKEQFHIMFSGIIPDRKKHPALALAAEESFGQLVQIVEECREAGVIPSHRDRKVHTLAAWSMLHGIATLLIEGQIPGGRSRTRAITRSLLILLTV
jgi:AcrR family transcriptional regulator